MTNADKQFLENVKALADSASLSNDLANNPDMTKLFTITVYQSTLDPGTHATQVTMEGDFPREIVGLELMQIALSLIEGKGEPI
jgi:hypothetical protein